MFNNTDRKDGQIEAAEQQVQDVLKTASQELRGSRKAEGHDVTAQPQMDFERGSQTVQFEDRPSVKIDSSRDALLTEFGKATLTDRYLMPGETYQSLFARVASFMVMMKRMLSVFMTIFQSCGLCLQLLFYRMGVQIEVCQFPAFSMKPMTAFQTLSIFGMRMSGSPHVVAVLGLIGGIYARLVRRLVKTVRPPALCRLFVLWTV